MVALDRGVQTTCHRVPVAGQKQQEKAIAHKTSSWATLGGTWGPLWVWDTGLEGPPVFCSRLPPHFSPCNPHLSCPPLGERCCSRGRNGWRGNFKGRGEPASLPPFSLQSHLPGHLLGVWQRAERPSPGALHLIRPESSKARPAEPAGRGATGASCSHTFPSTSSRSAKRLREAPVTSSMAGRITLHPA